MGMLNAVAGIRPKRTESVTALDISRQHDARPLARFGSASIRRPVSEAIAAADLGDDDWPCPTCGLIGCDHDEDLPPYRGAFLTEGRH